MIVMMTETSQLSSTVSTTATAATDDNPSSPPEAEAAADVEKFDHVEEDEKEAPDCEVMDYIQRTEATSTTTVVPPASPDTEPLSTSPPLHPRQSQDLTEDRGQVLHPNPEQRSPSSPPHLSGGRQSTDTDAEDSSSEDEDEDEGDDEDDRDDRGRLGHASQQGQQQRHSHHYQFPGGVPKFYPLSLPSSRSTAPRSDHSFLAPSQNGTAMGSDLMLEEEEEEEEDTSAVSSPSSLTQRGIIWTEDPLDRVLGQIVAKVPDFGLMTLTEPVMDSFADFIRWNFDTGVINHSQMRQMLQNLYRLYSVVHPTPPELEPAGIMQAEHHLQALARAMKDVITGVSIRRRKFMFKHYHDVFSASGAVTWMVERGFARDREEAVQLGKALLAHGYIRHVSGMKTFKDKKLFFIFNDKQHVSLRFPNGKNPFCASMLNLVYHVFENSVDEWMQNCSLDALRLAYPIVFIWTAFQATEAQATKVMHGFCEAVGQRDDFHVAMIGFLRANDDIMSQLKEKCVDITPCCPSHRELQKQPDGGWTAVLTPTPAQAATLDFMDGNMPAAAASVYEARRTTLINPFTGDRSNVQLRKIYKTSARPCWIRFTPPKQGPALHRSSSISGKVFSEAIASYHNDSPSPSHLSFHRSVTDDWDSESLASLPNTGSSSYGHKDLQIRNSSPWSPSRRSTGPIQTRPSKLVKLQARPPRSPALPIAVQQQQMQKHSSSSVQHETGGNGQAAYHQTFPSRRTVSSSGSNLALIDTSPLASLQSSTMTPRAVLASPTKPRKLWSEDSEISDTEEEDEAAAVEQSSHPVQQETLAPAPTDDDDDDSTDPSSSAAGASPPSSSLSILPSSRPLSSGSSPGTPTPPLPPTEESLDRTPSRPEETDRDGQLSRPPSSTRVTRELSTDSSDQVYSFGSRPSPPVRQYARRSSLPSTGSGGRSACAVCRTPVCFSCALPHCPTCNPENAEFHLDSYHQIIPLPYPGQPQQQQEEDSSDGTQSPSSPSLSSRRSSSLVGPPPRAVSIQDLQEGDPVPVEEYRPHPFMHSGDFSSCAAPRLRRGIVTDAIAKRGDDLRQDQAVQLIFACCSAFWAASPNSWRFGRPPYARTIEVVVTGPKTGFIEFLKGSVIKDVAKNGGWSKVNLKCWAPSAIGQLVMSFILGIRDRHEENWLLLGEPALNPEMVQIDFG